MSIVILGICGEMGHGKDTIGDYLVKEKGFTKISFAEPLKQACKHVFGLNDDQLYNEKQKTIVDPFWNMTPRKIMQLVGTDLFRNGFSDDIWIKSMIKRINNLLNEGITKIVITDVRFSNENDYVQKILGQTIKVVRPNKISGDKHVSETEISSIICNYTVYNDGSKDELYN
jgi:dephospho-CoA kinase